MPFVLRSILIVLLACSSLQAVAQDNPLPRVLIIGDAIYQQNTRELPKLLKGKADITVINAHELGVVNSQTVLSYLDQILGRVDRNGKPVPQEKWPAWDLIHFNVGLGDLIYVVPDLKSFRALPFDSGGEIATSAKQYEQNLNKLVVELKQKAPDAKLVWASTTPIRHSSSHVFKVGSEMEYNTIAAKVMAKHRVEVNDMHRFAIHLIDMDKPAGHGADPFTFDKKPIHMPIVRVIERAFGFKPMAETDEEKAVNKALAEPSPSQG